MPSMKAIALAGVVTAIGIGYIGPVNAYLDQKSELAREQERLAALEAERERLSGLIKALDEPSVLEARARELGYVRPGEVPFVVNGLKRVRGQGGDERDGAADGG